ncbi:galactoside 2-alpha-L-fucosyltransferase SEC1-like isoform X4 [Penaeus chinensis]|uniref:galactoside 2-alpha-L-fucosyltransferase SEC1-like isoform X4 n=1 Tax=Penaeus chinensis TaxID=139456 RepID=UPI001FB7748A|nr:galactoside 2-alpha-L-fucosyltransferase SEC1-like isoform X4 [Penaeus chinensis]
MAIFPNKVSRLISWRAKTTHKAVTFSLAAICIVSLYGILDTFIWQPFVMTATERLRMDRVSTVLQEDKTVLHVHGPWVPQSKWVQYPDRKWRGYPLPVLTSQPLGRLGNVMGEYASLWALTRIYNVTAFVTPSMRAKLAFFNSLSLPVIPGDYVRSEWQDVGKSGSFFGYNYTNIERAAAGLLGPKLFCLKPYPL